MPVQMSVGGRIKELKIDTRTDEQVELTNEELELIHFGDRNYLKSVCEGHEECRQRCGCNPNCQATLCRCPTRVQLTGNCVLVPVFEHLLAPLKPFFC